MSGSYLGNRDHEYYDNDCVDRKVNACIPLVNFWLMDGKSITLDNGSLGSRIDEERSEMRYVMRIAQTRESLNLWTHIAPCFGKVYLFENL